jgi:hypothetical protein
MKFCIAPKGRYINSPGCNPEKNNNAIAFEPHRGGLFIQVKEE